MEHSGRRATLVGIAANACLCIVKALAAAMTGSLAIASDAINSFSDTVYSIALFVAVRVSGKKADSDHPFGHHRAEPVAGLFIAIMAGILGFEVIKTGIAGLMDGTIVEMTIVGVAALIFSMSLKTGMWLYFGKVARLVNSPAIKASSIDSRNDVLVSFTALIGLSGSMIGLPKLDCYAAVFIGFFILRSAYKIGMENIDYLMGKKPDDKVMAEIIKSANSVKGVRGVHDILAHYVGSYVHVQVHIDVDGDLKVKEAHDIGDRVAAAVEKVPSVDKAFIHLDAK